MPAMMRLQESRVLEICTHGLMRGADLTTALYSTQTNSCFLRKIFFTTASTEDLEQLSRNQITTPEELNSKAKGCDEGATLVRFDRK